MGFNLEMFFEELLGVLNDTCMGSAEKYRLAKEIAEREYKYAKECGVVK